MVRVAGLQLLYLSRALEPTSIYLRACSECKEPKARYDNQGPQKSYIQEDHVANLAVKLSCKNIKKTKIQLAPSISTVLIAIFAYILATPISKAQVVRRNASSTNEKSLNLNIRHTLNARSSATTSGNTKVKAEANIKIAPGSTITSTIGGDNSSSTIEFNTEENSFDLSATGIESEAVYVLDESTQLYSEIEQIDSASDEATNGDASAALIQETTLDVTFQDRENLSTFQQAF